MEKTIHDGTYYAIGFDFDLYALNGKKSYHQISCSLEATKLDVIIIVSLWNLTGISSALLPMCMSNVIAIGKVQTRITRLPDYTRSWGKTSVRLVHRSSGLTPMMIDTCINNPRTKAHCHARRWVAHQTGLYKYVGTMILMGLHGTKHAVIYIKRK